MLSDDEIVALVLKHMARVNAGTASLYLAGEQLMRELLEARLGVSEEEASLYAVPERTPTNEEVEASPWRFGTPPCLNLPRVDTGD